MSKKPETPISKLKPLFVDLSETGYEVQVPLGVTSADPNDMQDACSYIAFACPRMTIKLDPRIGGDPWKARRFELVGYDTLHSVDRATYAQLVDVVKPQYRASGSAKIHIRRAANGIHTDTVVKLRLFKGSPQPLTQKDIEEIDGVARAIVCAGHKEMALHFSIKRDELARGEEIVASVAQKLSLYLPSGITLDDPDPDARLLPDLTPGA